jgi:hypothetical protein
MAGGIASVPILLAGSDLNDFPYHAIFREMHGDSKCRANTGDSEFVRLGMPTGADGASTIVWA